MKIRKQAAALAATVAVTAGTLAAEVPAAEAGTPWHIDVVECNGTGNQHEDFVQWENALWDAWVWLDRAEAQGAWHIGRVRISKGTTLWQGWNFQGQCGINASGPAFDAGDPQPSGGQLLSIIRCNSTSDDKRYIAMITLTRASFQSFEFAENNPGSTFKLEASGADDDASGNTGFWNFGC